MYALLPQILGALRGGEPIALATVVGRRGSLPMANEARLLVRADGSIDGTVGGGCLEADVYARAQELLREGGSRLDEFHLNEVEEGMGGHVCGGTATVLTRAFHPDDATLAFFDAAATLQDTEPDLRFGSRLQTGAAVHALVASGGIRAALGASADEMPPSGPALIADERWFTEPVRPAPLLVVFGAGHCGAAIGAAASTAGFRVWMLEDRPAFLEVEQLPWAERLRRVDFTELPALPDGDETYYAIVTRGHEHDLAILRQVLDKPLAYLGMIGSRRKRALFRSIIEDEGRDLAAFDRMRSPMGLAIGAQTPNEIAVAVVGELIAARHAAARSETSDATLRA